MKNKKIEKLMYLQQELMSDSLKMVLAKESASEKCGREENGGSRFEALSKAADIAECKRMEVGRLASEIESLRQELIEEKRKRKKLHRKLEKMEARWIKKFHKLEEQSDDEKAIMLMFFRRIGYTGKDSLSAVKKKMRKLLDKKSKLDEQLLNAFPEKKQIDRFSNF